MPRFSGRLARALFGAAALAAVTSCTLTTEPRFDAAVAASMQELAAETNLLFEELSAADGTALEISSYDSRVQRYRSLAARALTIRMLVEARGSGTGGVPAPLTALIGGAISPGLGDSAARLAAEYRDATQAYMTDYLRNLRALEAEDRASGTALGERAEIYAASLTRHREAVERYLTAFRRWEAGLGPRPDAPGAAPVAPAGGLAPRLVALRRAAIDDILRDALLYERDILNRNR